MSSLPFAAFVLLLSGLTVAGLALGGGDLLPAIVPALLVGALYLMWKLPLRYPVLALTFLALTLENPSDSPAVGLWQSPLYGAGKLLLAHLNLTFVGQKWLFFSGMDLLVAFLFAAALARHLRHEGPAQVETAGPMRVFAGLCIGAALWMWTWGVVQGGADVASALWQVQRVVYLPLFVFLFQLALRGARDRASLGKVIIAAACTKALVAIYVRATVPPPDGEPTLAYATTHADSMLFACAFCLVVSQLLERRGPARARLGGLVLPLLTAGMIANNRRIVWVELAAGLVTLYALTEPSRIKRALARAAALASPFALVYMIAGWGSTAAAFRPVQVIRSVVDSQADGSTAWRDWENYNLFYTLRQSPFLGTGYGHGYIEIVKLPDISQAYALYRFIPHNSILGLWAYGGFVGFTALWTMLVVGIFFAVRAQKHATLAADRAAALSVTAAIVVYLVHCYGDLGLGTWTSVFTIAPALAVSAQLAPATGAWPASTRRPASAPVDLGAAQRCSTAPTNAGSS